MCNDKAWSSFACVFALSSILKRTISMNYPDFNPIKYRVLFNQTVMSRSFHENGEKDMEVEIKLLYCNLRPSSTCDFFANHFVPLVKKKTDKKSVKSLKRTISLSSNQNTFKRSKLQSSHETLSFKFPKLHAFYPSIPKYSTNLSSSVSTNVTTSSSLSTSCSVSVTKTTFTMTKSVSNSISLTSTIGTTQTFPSVTVFDGKSPMNMFSTYISNPLISNLSDRASLISQDFKHTTSTSSVIASKSKSIHSFFISRSLSSKPTCKAPSSPSNKTYTDFFL